mmetsp:Transcript_15364/g.42955  ORF Transcript_15364/g.42955 Transcript_15364/m.42955 type:complete len:488 (-) Transcript_15364:724-2187(-)
MGGMGPRKGLQRVLFVVIQVIVQPHVLCHGAPGGWRAVQNALRPGSGCVLLHSSPLEELQQRRQVAISLCEVLLEGLLHVLVLCHQAFHLLTLILDLATGLCESLGVLLASDLQVLQSLEQLVLGPVRVLQRRLHGRQQPYDPELRLQDVGRHCQAMGRQRRQGLVEAAAGLLDVHLESAQLRLHRLDPLGLLLCSRFLPLLELLGLLELLLCPLLGVAVQPCRTVHLELRVAVVGGFQRAAHHHGQGPHHAAVARRPGRLLSVRLSLQPQPLRLLRGHVPLHDHLLVRHLKPRVVALALIVMVDGEQGGKLLGKGLLVSGQLEELSRPLLNAGVQVGDLVSVGALALHHGRELLVEGLLLLVDLLLQDEHLQGLAGAAVQLQVRVHQVLDVVAVRCCHCRRVVQQLLVLHLELCQLLVGDRIAGLIELHPPRYLAIDVELCALHLHLHLAEHERLLELPGVILLLLQSKVGHRQGRVLHPNHCLQR